MCLSQAGFTIQADPCPRTDNAEKRHFHATNRVVHWQEILIGQIGRSATMARN
jgi:hypothetical protein